VSNFVQISENFNRLPLVMSAGFMVMTLRKMLTTLSMEKSKLTETEKGDTGEMHAYNFLCH
jgi:hypothetical protein